MDDAPWADEEAYLLAIWLKEIRSNPPIPQHQGATGAKHGAAMELAPSKEPIGVIEDILLKTAKPLTEMLRPMLLRNLKRRRRMELKKRRTTSGSGFETMPEPIMDSSGEPLLEAGGVHFLDKPPLHGWSMQVLPSGPL